MTVDLNPVPPYEPAHHLQHLDLGCYIVDALDAQERAAFEAHLGSCETCPQELYEFAETSAELARLAHLGPPRLVRGDMLATIRTVRPLPPTLDELPPTPDEPSIAAPPDRAPSRPAARNRLLLAIVAVAAGVALLFGGLVVNLQRSQQEMAPTQLPAPPTVQRQTDLLAAPDAAVRVAPHGGGRFTFVVSRERDEALLIATGLPDPGAGKAYQLWTLRDGRPTPDASLTDAKAGQWFTGPVRDASGLAVTLEPSGGSAQPTSPLLAEVTLED